MLKQYIDRDSSSVTPISVVSSVPQEQSEMNSEDMNFTKSDPASLNLQNSDILKVLDQKLSHLDPVQRKELEQLFHQYEHLFPDIPTRTDKIYHDVNVEDSQPVKEHPYRMNPTKQYLKKEIQYLHDNDITEPKTVREKSRECHNHKPQPFPDIKRKKKPTNPHKHKSIKHTKSTKISSLFPKRGNRNAKRTEKHKYKMPQGKTYKKSPRRINHKAPKNKTNTGTTA